MGAPAAIRSIQCSLKDLRIYNPIHNGEEAFYSPDVRCGNEYLL
jgi:hypothetical protein